MKLHIEKKLEILILSIICIILSNLIYITLSINGEVSIEYKTSKDGSVQLFYDNHSTDAFDVEHSITKKLENSNNELKTVNIPISLKNSNKIRIDIDGNEKIELNKIYLSTMGITVRSISKNDIINEFSILHDGEWNYENNILTVTLKGTDLFFCNTNVDANLKFIKIVSAIVGLLFTLLILKLWKIIDFKLRINNIKSKILVVVFISLLILPTLIYKLDGENLEQSTENRVLKEKPSISINNIMRYPKEYEEYYIDNLAFKSSLVRLNSIIKYEVLNTSPAKYVIKGTEGWLFYNSKYKSNDDDTLADYQRTNKYTKEEKEARKNILLDREKFLREQGIEMYMLIPPNKSQVYSEFMPNKFKKISGNSKVEDMIDYLRENTEIPIVYPMEEFRHYKPQYQLYYKLDTHWNDIGAYVGYTELMKVIDKDFKYKDLNELEIVSKPIVSGDLSKMINMDGIVNDNQYTVTNVKNEIVSTLVKQDGNSELRYSSTNLNGKKLLCFRDSFSTALIPYLSKEFQESVYLRGIPYSEELIKKEKPDIVIFESVERLTNFN